jgi:serine/threonine-protein kinase
MTANAGRVLNGRYRLIRTVGVGSQASVWVAEHLALTTQVAVKLIDPELAKRPDARERFKREATAAAQLRSPHVVQILDHGIDGDQPFIVMELLEGEDLFQRLEKRHHLSIKETSKILTQVARALTRAHAAGIVHRDLKPENVFLTHNEDDEVVKVLDFGVAKVRDAAKVTMQKTGVGTLVGTPHYMSPEQVKGIGEVDYRTDIWAMGVLGYQCVTGEMPFDSEGVGDLLIRITIGDMPVPSKVMMGIPPAFDAWFARACDRDPQRRFASARACAEGLARLAGLASATQGPTAVPRPGASIPPPADPTKRTSELPPAPSASKPGAKPPGRPPPPGAAAAKAAPPPPEEEELDDGDWEEAEPVVPVSVAPPAFDDDEDVPAAGPRAILPAKGPAAPPDAVTAELPAAPRLPLPSRAQRDSMAHLPPARDSQAPAPPAAAPAPVVEAHDAEPPAAREPMPSPAPHAKPATEGPINPFLVNDFVAPPAAPGAPARGSMAAIPAPQGPPSSGGARPAPISTPSAPAYTAAVPRSTVSGVETADFDDEELAFGKNRRKKLVRWLTLGLVLLVAGVTWMVVSSQLRARDPSPDAATAPPADTKPSVPPAYDTAPPTATASTAPSASATSTASTKPSGKPRPTAAPGTGHAPVVRPTAQPQQPKKPNDGSVEIPDDPGLPPPAP